MSTQQPRKNAPPSSAFSAFNLPGIELPSGYQQLIDNNPWENAYRQYQPGIWDRLGNWLGFRTKEDKYREDLQLASLQNQYQLATTAREEDYNSELSQVARQRSAGLNPDLTGVNPSQASEYNEPDVPLEAPGDYSQECMNLIGSIFSGATTILGIAKDIQGLQSGSLGIEAGRLDMLSGYYKSAEDFLLANATEDSFETDKYGNVYNVRLPDLTGSGLSRRQQKRFLGALTSKMNSLSYRQGLYDRYKSLQDSRKGVASYRGNSNWSDDDDYVAQIYGSFGKLSDDIFEIKSLYDILFTGNLKAFEERRKELGLPALGADFEELKTNLGLKTGDNELAYQTEIESLNLPSDRAKLEDSQVANASITETQVNQLGVPSNRAIAENKALIEQIAATQFSTDVNSMIRTVVGDLKNLSESTDPKTPGWVKSLASVGMVLVSLASMYFSSGAKVNFSSSSGPKGTKRESSFSF